MPLVYEGKCSACNYVMPIGSEGYIAVVVDEPSSSMFVHPEQPRLVILAHPGESRIMKGLGFSYPAAAFGGRLVSVRNVICLDCGTNYEIRKLFANSAALGCSGCVAILALGGIIGGVARWQSESFWIGSVAGMLSLYGFFGFADWVIARWVRRRYKDCALEFERAAGCPKCSSVKYEAFRSSMRPLPCRECGQDALRIRSIGKS